MPDIASSNSTPIGQVGELQVGLVPGDRDLAADRARSQNARNAGRIDRYGASRKTSRSAVSGIDCSLKNSLMPSASVCSTPNGPGAVGPIRFCMSAMTLRMNQM